MIDRQQLLSDLQALLRTVEDDLRDRSEDAELPEVSSWLKTQYESAKEAGRTAQTRKSWVDDFVTQVVAAWVLSCVFVRYLEDNALVDPPRITGPAKDASGGQSRLKRARDEYDHWVQKNRGQTDREYLLDIFAGLAEMPAAGEVFGRHYPLNALPNWLSGDAAAAMLAFFQKVDADTGEITHDFTDPSGDTRFLDNRLRHTAGTEVRKAFGLEAAQCVLGHSRADVTQIYAERDLQRWQWLLVDRQHVSSRAPDCPVTWPKGRKIGGLGRKGSRKPVHPVRGVSVLGLESLSLKTMSEFQIPEFRAGYCYFVNI